MADLADIVKRHEDATNYTGEVSLIQIRDWFNAAHIDRAALIAMVKEAHAALKPFADAWKIFETIGFAPTPGGLKTAGRVEAADLRQAARILAVRE